MRTYTEVKWKKVRIEIMRLADLVEIHIILRHSTCLFGSTVNAIHFNWTTLDIRPLNPLYIIIICIKLLTWCKWWHVSRYYIESKNGCYSLCGWQFGERHLPWNNCNNFCNITLSEKMSVFGYLPIIAKFRGENMRSFYYMYYSHSALF